MVHVDVILREKWKTTQGPNWETNVFRLQYVRIHHSLTKT